MNALNGVGRDRPHHPAMPAAIRLALEVALVVTTPGVPAGTLAAIDVGAEGRGAIGAARVGTGLVARDHRRPGRMFEDRRAGGCGSLREAPKEGHGPTVYVARFSKRTACSEVPTGPLRSYRRLWASPTPLRWRDVADSSAIHSPTGRRWR